MHDDTVWPRCRGYVEMKKREEMKSVRNKMLLTIIEVRFSNTNKF